MVGLRLVPLWICFLGLVMDKPRLTVNTLEGRGRWPAWGDSAPYGGFLRMGQSWSP